MPTLTNLSDLFTDMLKDVYYAENKILKELPKMAKSLEKGSKLAAAFEKHWQETEGQIERLERVFKIIGEKVEGKKCDALDGLAKEAGDLMENVEAKDTLEAGLLAGAQAVEHYEIARYGTLVEWARNLGHEDAAKLLEQTLEEEKKTNQLLTKMALDSINQRAMECEGTESEEEKAHTPHHKRRTA